jgi:hypothetical protein
MTRDELIKVLQTQYLPEDTVVAYVWGWDSVLEGLEDVQVKDKDSLARQIWAKVEKETSEVIDYVLNSSDIIDDPMREELSKYWEDN